MLNNKTIAVVVPCYNEETQIGMVIESMPAFVDRIIVVNDRSTDATSEVVLNLMAQADNHDLHIPMLTTVKGGRYNHATEVAARVREHERKQFTPCKVLNTDPDNQRVILIEHLENGGVGAAIAQGYLWARDHGMDCTAVMAGDGQMDPDELESICRPVIAEGIDYVKGNRLIHRSALLVIPKLRFLGNSVLSIMTKMASGYWHVSDTQCGYTAISSKGLNAIMLHRIYPRYGMPNDMLVKLNIAFCTLREVEVKPVYNIGERSKMVIPMVIPSISWLLFRSFFTRLWRKYLFRDFHPLFLLYHFAMVLGLLWLPYIWKVAMAMVEGENLSFETLFAFSFLGITSVQSFLFAMWMDIQDNERLYR
jgi:glycosyltransferase involved in cell wall biosynthesis